MFHRLNIRQDINLTETNVELLTLGEAVMRWRADGQFMMTEVNPSDSYESKDNDIPLGSSSDHIGKIEAALTGMDFVKEVKAGSSDPAPASDPVPVSDPAPSSSSE